MGNLKNCPTCGYDTTRDFCTPDCRMQDSDARIEGVEEERDKYKKALEEIIDGLSVCEYIGREISTTLKICQEALKLDTATKKS